MDKWLNKCKMGGERMKGWINLHRSCQHNADSWMENFSCWLDTQMQPLCKVVLRQNWHPTEDPVGSLALLEQAQQPLGNAFQCPLHFLKLRLSLKALGTGCRIWLTTHRKESVKVAASMPCTTSLSSILPTQCLENRESEGAQFPSCFAMTLWVAVSGRLLGIWLNMWAGDSRNEVCGMHSGHNLELSWHS